VSREARLYLDDMLAAAAAARRYVNDVTFDAFVANDEKRAAVERQIFIVGEAAARLPGRYRPDDAPVPWRAIIGLRNILAHGYWSIAPSELWDVATVHLPVLETHLRELLESLPESR
jgi:uncharacterized protein with HEPN domain